jgi:hypothetical protein
LATLNYLHHNGTKRDGNLKPTGTYPTPIKNAQWCLLLSVPFYSTHFLVLHTLTFIPIDMPVTANKALLSLLVISCLDFIGTQAANAHSSSSSRPSTYVPDFLLDGIENEHSLNVSQSKWCMFSSCVSLYTPMNSM